MRTLLGENRSSYLQAAKEKINNYLVKLHWKTKKKNQELGSSVRLIKKTPTTQFNVRKLTWKEVEEVIKAARTASVPGPNKGPYLIYK